MTELESAVYFKSNMAGCLDWAHIFKKIAFLTERSQIPPTAEQRQDLESFITETRFFHPLRDTENLSNFINNLNTETSEPAPSGSSSDWRVNILAFCNHLRQWKRECFLTTTAHLQMGKNRISSKFPFLCMSFAGDSARWVLVFLTFDLFRVIVFLLIYFDDRTLSDTSAYFTNKFML